MYYYCYHCWSDLEEDFKRCPRCGKELSSFSALNFHEKLIHALDHPERLTLQRVIWIIGNLKIERALPKLADIAEESDICKVIIKDLALKSTTYERIE
ncbi:MAG TPA: hypothetical protein ACFYD7_13940 [Candidatus Wujingus californicus]|uniref:hypothetical protein n=1 Tax=Candidatus Wujingus californicus TaxID=3367618 RepID=UPI00402529B0